VCFGNRHYFIVSPNGMMEWILLSNKNCTSQKADLSTEVSDSAFAMGRFLLKCCWSVLGRDELNRMAEWLVMRLLRAGVVNLYEDAAMVRLYCANLNIGSGGFGSSSLPPLYRMRGYNDSSGVNPELMTQRRWCLLCGICSRVNNIYLDIRGCL
jgi:hypothetical protein